MKGEEGNKQLSIAINYILLKKLNYIRIDYYLGLLEMSCYPVRDAVICCWILMKRRPLKPRASLFSRVSSPL